MLTSIVKYGTICTNDHLMCICTVSGQEHDNQYNKRIIGITLDNLRRIPTVIVVAAGMEKAKAILGALRSQAIDVLCTDDQAARTILDRLAKAGG